jgi:phenylalanyl-tRNA synthetase alpha subunit
VNIGAEEKKEKGEKVEPKYACTDVRGREKKEKKVTFVPGSLPIERLAKNWREVHEAKQQKKRQEHLAYKAKKEAGKEERKREEGKLVKEMEKKRKATELIGSSTPAIRGSTPLNQSAPNIKLPDLTKPPPATTTHTNIVKEVKEKKIPGLFDLNFDQKTRKLIPKVNFNVPLVSVPPPHQPNRFNDPPPKSQPNPPR